MNSFSVIEITDKRWQEFIVQSRQHDIYHTQTYHLLQKEGDPLLFVAQYDHDFLALPLILRKINQTDFRDFTSSYGYAGPVSNLDFEDLKPEMFAYFRSELNQYFKERKIVTAFSRLHPIIVGDKLFENFGIVRNIKDMVAIDLGLPWEEQEKQYRESHKRKIRQLREKKGYLVREANSEEELRDFVGIYKENMKRVNASINYFFDYDYFYELLHNKSFSSKLLLAIKNGEIAAGSVFTIAGKIMQYHLNGTKERYLQEAPMKVIIDEARLIGNQLGLEYLHLGGSVGDIETDSLYYFKAGFSDTRFRFRVWQYVADEKAYDYLNQLFETHSKTSNYFPLYRA